MRFASIAAPLYVEDLENLLHETLLLSFNTEIEDGSIEQVNSSNELLDYTFEITIKLKEMSMFGWKFEQVAEQLMMIYEENLQGSR